MLTELTIEDLADTLVLGGLLKTLRAFGPYELVTHWQQGEFHHDTILKTDCGLPGPYLVVATNCNGGVKEVWCFSELPTREALWHYRCPDNPAFQGELPTVLGHATTIHWFDPCDLLTDNARSELLPEHRERQEGGGWKMACRLTK
jgi:hypothetical protein